MIKILVAVAGIGGFILYQWYKRRRARIKKRNKLARGWGSPKDRKHTWARIRYFFDLFGRRENTTTIDDDTWNDLNFDTLFGQLDHTESDIGQQILYDLLRRPVLKKSTLKDREKWIKLFAEKEDFRLDLQMQLQKLTGFGMWRLTHLFYEELPEIPQWFHALMAIPVIAVSLIVLGFFNPVFFLFLAFLPIVNLFIQYIGESRILRHTSALSSLSVFLSTTGKIDGLNKRHGNPLGETGDQINANYRAVRNLEKKVSTVLDEGNTNEMSYFLTEFLNLIFLAKINMFTLSVHSISQNQKKLQKLFHTVGYIDAMIAAASYKASLTQHCTPVFDEAQTKLRYENMIHPLLEDPVANSVEVGKKGILVTGSNMSGKSTFLKTIGVNQILAQTFNYCCADKAEITFCGVISSMRREDDITEGESFYLGEVKRVRKLIDVASQQEGHNLFLLDEIFRGTNTIERIASSLEVLRWLNRLNNFVLASTHDLELVDLLGREYTFFHFSETITDGAMTFDYKLKSGQSSTKNAIRLLGINDYPHEIVARAMEASEKLEKQGVINYRAGVE